MAVKVTKGQICSGTISKICHKEHYLCGKFHTFFTNSTECLTFWTMPLNYKQSCVGKSLKEFFFPAFESNSNLCPANALRVYVDRTSSIRKSETSLFLTSTPSHRPASAAAIARWIRLGYLKLVSILKEHSVPSASTSAADAGLSISKKMEAADWSSASVFEKFYYRPQTSSSFEIDSASNLHS